MKNPKNIIFSLTSSKVLTNEILKYLDLPLGEVDITHFADGEIMARTLSSVRDHDVYVIQSTSPPVTENLMELLIFIDSLKRSSAQSITVVMPYFGYSRQDRMARPREPITARLVADLLSVAGINRLITVDLHTLQIQGFFTLPVDVLSSIPLLAKKIRTYLEKHKIKTENVVVVSPDHGSALRARDLASLLPNSRLAIIDKRRPAPDEVEIISLIGDVKGCTTIIIDDIIDTGKTIHLASHALQEQGAKKIIVAATHGVFSQKALDKLNNRLIEKIFITDTIPYQDHPLVEVVSLAPLLAKVIKNLTLGLPISPIYDEYYD